MNRREYALKLVNDLFDDYPDADISVDEMIDYEFNEALQKHIPRTYRIELSKPIED